MNPREIYVVNWIEMCLFCVWKPIILKAVVNLQVPNDVGGISWHAERLISFWRRTSPDGVWGIADHKSVLFSDLTRVDNLISIVIFIRTYELEKLWSVLQIRQWELNNISVNTQNYWVSWTFPSSSILESRKHDVSETGSVSVLRWKGRRRRLLSWAP
jgi:hypothetical protein